MKAALAVLVLCLAGAAEAHPLDTGYLRIDAERDAFAITFDIDVALAAELLRVEPGAIDPVLGPRAGELAGKLYRTAAPVAGDGSCTWGTVAAQRRGTTVTIAETATCPAGPVRWDLSFVKRLAATFQILGKVRAHGTEQVITIDKHSTSIEVTGATGGFGDALRDGVAHSGVLPRGWPGGLEHILFVVLLVLAGGTLARGFVAVGMLIAGTLAGGFASTLVALPASVLAVAVALTIAAAAVGATTGKLDRHVWVVGALGGVLHGLAGAAGHWIGFDLGLSIGHVVIALVLGPPVAMARAHVPRQVVAVVAIASALVAIYVVVRAL